METKADSEHENELVAKKARLESESLSENVRDNNVEQMQTDSTQITNLVSIFNAGFGGLCSDDDSNKDKNNNEKQYSNENIFYNAVQSISGFSIKDNKSSSSCATQIIDSKLDSVPMATPIALTV